MAKFFTPIEAKAAQITNIPNVVIEAVNTFLATNPRGCTILQKDLIKEIKKRVDVTDSVIFENHWLDFEQILRKEGWDVSYDRPGFNESYYEPSWTIRPRRNDD